MTNRCCTDCGKEKPIADFASAGIINGVKYYRYKCKECYYTVKYSRRMQNREWFMEYRKSLKCISCGNDDHRVLEFHHRDPKVKESAVTLMMYHSRDKIQKEIEKCDALCANCHRILHYEERKAKKSGD